MLANYYQYGTSDYLEGSFFFGEIGVNITKEMVVALFTAPILLLAEHNARKKFFAIAVFSVTLLIIVIGLKRAALLSVGAGFFVYLFYSRQKAKTIKSVFVILLLLLALSPYFITVVYERYEARSQKVSMSYQDLSEDEGRITEFIVVTDNFRKKPFFEKIFGSNPFLLKEDYFGMKRMIHIDYLSLLDGGGIAGLLTYIWVYVAIFIYLINQSKIGVADTFLGEIRAVGIALIAVQLVMGIAGTITGIPLRGHILLLLGGICGVLRQEHINVKQRIK